MPRVAPVIETVPVIPSKNITLTLEFAQSPPDLSRISLIELSGGPSSTRRKQQRSNFLLFSFFGLILMKVLRDLLNGLNKLI